MGKHHIKGNADYEKGYRAGYQAGHQKSTDCKIKFYRQINQLQDEITALKSAEPKVGKWIERDDGWENVFYECSECGEAFTLIDGTPTDNLYYYCPTCGAKMERGE